MVVGLEDLNLEAGTDTLAGPANDDYSRSARVARDFTDPLRRVSTASPLRRQCCELGKGQR